MHKYMIVRERSQKNEDGTYRTNYGVVGRYYTLSAAIDERDHQERNGNYGIAKTKDDTNPLSIYLNTFDSQFFDEHCEFVASCKTICREPVCDTAHCEECLIRNGCAEWIG